MTVSINGKSAKLSADATIVSVLAYIGVEAPWRGVAVAVNAEVVPRSKWEDFSLSEGANIEVLTAIQGG